MQSGFARWAVESYTDRLDGWHDEEHVARCPATVITIALTARFKSSLRLQSHGLAQSMT